MGRNNNFDVFVLCCNHFCQPFLRFPGTAKYDRLVIQLKFLYEFYGIVSALQLAHAIITRISGGTGIF